MITAHSADRGAPQQLTDTPQNLCLIKGSLLWSPALLHPGVSTRFVVRSPFWAKHHVVVQNMARWMKCPLPPTPTPSPTPPPTLNPPYPQTPPPYPRPPPCRRQGGQGRIGDITGKGLRTAVALSTASCLRFFCLAQSPVKLCLGYIGRINVQNFALRSRSAPPARDPPCASPNLRRFPQFASPRLLRNCFRSSSPRCEPCRKYQSSAMWGGSTHRERPGNS